ncbi:MAG: alkaline phosphatase D family protein [Labilithrix sp.]|nr:alkaline phosphatase D family protein [Labilithrix sp.]
MRGPRGYHMLGRRGLVLGGLLAGCTRRRAPHADGTLALHGRPEAAWGVQSGDVTASRAVVWCRADRAARLAVEWSTSPSFEGPRRAAPSVASAETDYVAKASLDELPAGTRIHYRARFEAERESPWIAGSFSTAPQDDRDVTFAWSGDTNGQGWGIDPSRGGMPAYAALLARSPDFFLHCGDAIYADNPIPPEIALADGTVWRNVVTPAKSRVADTLDDFRGAFLYSRLSSEVRALSASVPTFAIWDDHEVQNNWFPGMSPAVDRRAVSARRAMFEHWPTLVDPSRPMYRSVKWGPRLEVFLLDGRSHRTPNDPAPPAEAFLGSAQLAWLIDALTRSKATWKVIVCNMPIGLVVSEPARGGGQAFDGLANRDGPPSGREVELATLFSALRARGVDNVVWLTADVHFAAAHHYDPSRAQLDMSPFWEFVAGPMHATSFPRKPLDDTFGPEVVYVSTDWTTLGSPATGAQSFGVIRIDGRSGMMTVTLVDGRGRDLHSSVLRPR